MIVVFVCVTKHRVCCFFVRVFTDVLTCTVMISSAATSLSCSVLHTFDSCVLQICCCHAADLPASGWGCCLGLDTVKINRLVCLEAAVAAMFIAVVTITTVR